MEMFELTWRGPLPCDQGNGRSPKVATKQSIRAHFHHQFAAWVQGNQMVTVWADRLVVGALKPAGIECRKEDIRRVIAMSGMPGAFSSCVLFGGQRYVPLLRVGQSLFCDLDIKILARPSQNVRRDTDNRVKLLIDALRIPRQETEVAGSEAVPPDPCFCLLEDDGGELIHQVCSVTRPLLTLPMPSRENEVEVQISGMVQRRG